MESNTSQHRLLKPEDRPIVFTALSKKYFYMRMLVVKYVLEQGRVPLNPFMAFDYFLTDIVDRNIIRNATYNLVRLGDEVWVFGSISDGVIIQIKQALTAGKPVRYFQIFEDREIAEVDVSQMIFEDGLELFLPELQEANNPKPAAEPQV